MHAELEALVARSRGATTLAERAVFGPAFQGALSLLEQAPANKAG